MKKGFTLAELLAVVIIVALMATFSIGYYTKSKEQAYFSEFLNQVNSSAEAVNQEFVEWALQGRASEYSPAEFVSSCRGNYCVVVNTDFASVPGLIACVGTNNKGKAFCESVGYRNCSAGEIGDVSGQVCYK